MFYHKPLRMKDVKQPTEGTKEVIILCGKRKVGSIIQYKNVDETIASCFFVNNKSKEVGTFQKGLTWIEDELNQYIYDIIRPDV